ncbi:DUF4349 domain-containing protein [Paenibacillus sp. N4]|uniref:DUF4349 domain-containing protein n=1 Tax=Paenibacillus vietnamensis TaxID=2590547 RepID=UPI001CD0B1B4|nr:DUF4349 domain-containing protein [Paenibacillus vietnamensis]MCA0753818.1 DUF4349 domain-containing protein [Paenibacillus vietnamensis]
MKKQRKSVYVWLVFLLLAGLLAGCSAGNADDSKAQSERGTANGSGSVGGAAPYNGNAADEEATTASGGESGGESEGAGGIAAETLAGAEAFNQKIIYTANLTMKVDDLAAAAGKLRSAITQSGGYILQFQDTRYNGEIGSSYTIKVPAAGFMPFIDLVEQIEHRSFERNIGGKDVSEEYVDLEARLKAKQLVEARLLEMMDKATKADDLLKFSDQIGQVQEEIERIQGRLRYLDNNVAFSTVELSMYQTDQTVKQLSAADDGLGGKMLQALTDNTRNVWEGVKLLLIFVAGALPVLIALAVIAAPIIWLRRKKAKAAAALNRPSAPQSQPDGESQG